jgi:putative ABC transport system permease protein
MIKKYLRVAIRTLFLSRLFSFIKIFGHSLSMSVCMMVILRAGDELSFDSVQPVPERTYWVINSQM